MTDMAHGGGRAAGRFDNSDWRDNVQARRMLARDVVMQAVEGTCPLEQLLEEVKKTLGHATLTAADKNRLSVLFSDIRIIVAAWGKLSHGERVMFEAGSLVPSALAKRIRHHAP